MIKIMTNKIILLNWQVTKWIWFELWLHGPLRGLSLFPRSESFSAISGQSYGDWVCSLDPGYKLNPRNFDRKCMKMIQIEGYKLKSAFHWSCTLIFRFLDLRMYYRIFSKFQNLFFLRFRVSLVAAEGWKTLAGGSKAARKLSHQQTPTNDG